MYDFLFASSQCLASFWVFSVDVLWSSFFVFFLGLSFSFYPLYTSSVFAYVEPRAFFVGVAAFIFCFTFHSRLGRTISQLTEICLERLKPTSGVMFGLCSLFLFFGP